VNVQLYTGELPEESPETLSTYFYDLPTTSIRRNRHIFPSGSALRIVNLPELFSRIGIHSYGPFIYPFRRSRSPVEGESKTVETARVHFTVYVVADLDSEEGLALVKEALGSMVHTLLFFCICVLDLSL
jgi:UDP-glucose:glycoprotein glucosyltransferase